jgi:drug/metabolite transporter (DMT)-like permease
MWSSAGLLSRLLETPSPASTAFWRSLFCAITMLLILMIEHRSGVFHALKRMGGVGWLSGLMWAIIFTNFMLAMMMTSVANTLLVIGMSPLLAAVLARIVLGERIALPTWFVIAIAAGGLWWMVREALSTEGPQGLLIAATVPLASAVNLVAIRRSGESVDLGPAVLLGASISCLAILPFIGAGGLNRPSPDLLILAALGAFQLAVPCWLMVRAARRLRPHEVSLIALLEVVVGPLWVWLGAGETTSATTLQGGAVIVSALIINEFFNARTRGPASVPAAVQSGRIPRAEPIQPGKT